MRVVRVKKDTFISLGQFKDETPSKKNWTTLEFLECENNNKLYLKNGIL